MQHHWIMTTQSHYYKYRGENQSNYEKGGYGQIFSNALPSYFEFRLNQNIDLGSNLSAIRIDQPYIRMPDASDPFGRFVEQKAWHRYKSRQFIEQLLSERKAIWESNSKHIRERSMSLFPEYSMSQRMSHKDPETKKRFLELAKERADLEDRLQEARLKLWQDALPLRRELLEAEQRYEAAKFRDDLLS